MTLLKKLFTDIYCITIIIFLHFLPLFSYFYIQLKLLLYRAEHMTHTVSCVSICQSEFKDNALQREVPSLLGAKGVGAEAFHMLCFIHGEPLALNWPY